MGDLKRFLILFLVTFAGGAGATTLVDVPREFANCAGRYSAMMEHAWLMNSEQAEDFADLREAFVTLLDASEGVPGRVSLNYRITAKFAQARLLRIATFGNDPYRAAVAQRQLEAHLVLCRQLLLGG